MNPSIDLTAASAGAVEAWTFVQKINEVILYPLILLLMGIAMLYFIYGCVKYIMNAENSSAREEGRSHIIYSIVGLFVMLMAYGLLMIAANTFGVGDMLDCAKNPLQSGCDNVMRVPGSGDYSGGANEDGGTSGGANIDNGFSGGALP
jgi:hypothetical protein